METAEQYAVTLDEQGRLVLPAQLGKRLGLRPGESRIAIVDADNAIRLVSKAEQAQKLFGLYRHLGNGRSVVDEFIAERHAESEREDDQ